MGDLFFILHDWLFTEQYLKASLLMPIALELFEQESDTEKKKKQAKRIILVVRVLFYSMTSVWFVFSAISGNLSVRVFIALIFIYITVVFMVSLFKIRSLINRVNTCRTLQTNHRLLNLNLVTSAAEGLFYGASFILSVVLT